MKGKRKQHPQIKKPLAETTANIVPNSETFKSGIR